MLDISPEAKQFSQCTHTDNWWLIVKRTSGMISFIHTEPKYITVISINCSFFAICTHACTHTHGSARIKTSQSYHIDPSAGSEAQIEHYVTASSSRPWNQTRTVNGVRSRTHGLSQLAGLLQNIHQAEATFSSKLKFGKTTSLAPARSTATCNLWAVQENSRADVTRSSSASSAAAACELNGSMCWKQKYTCDVSMHVWKNCSHVLKNPCVVQNVHVSFSIRSIKLNKDISSGKVWRQVLLHNKLHLQVPCCLNRLLLW